MVRVGDGADRRPDAGGRGQFVDHLLLDDGRIHVGEQELLAAVVPRHDGDVDRQPGELVAQGVLDAGCLRSQRQLQRLGLGQPARGPGRKPAQRLEHAAVEGARARPCNEDENRIHEPGWLSADERSLLQGRRRAASRPPRSNSPRRSTA
jgi:hypothetical protein